MISKYPCVIYCMSCHNRPMLSTACFKKLFPYLLLGCFLSACQEDILAPNQYEGCCATRPLQVDTQQLSIFIPNAITPNEDGLNDAFSIHTNRAFKIIHLTVEEQNDILSISRSNVEVSGVKEIWKPINAGGQPIHGLFNYQMMIDLPGTDTLHLQGSFCSIDCTENQTHIIDFPSCIFGSQTNGNGQIDTSQLLTENDCSF